MQIRLTVVDPLGPRPDASACDVLVTAPAGTALAAVASALAATVAGADASAVLYAGAERLDAQRCLLGEPPLTDGAVLSLGAPTDPGPEPDGAAAQLHVVAGPDAGGVHLLHGGQIRIGRSADADVPLDDPDVSRLHCAVTLAADGRVTVADLGSTNGTTVDGRPLGERPVRLAPGALLRLGESALRVAGAGDVTRPRPVDTVPDGEGHVRVTSGTTALPTAHPTAHPSHPAHPSASPAPPAPPAPGTDETRHAYGDASWGAAGESLSQDVEPVVPEQGSAPDVENTGSGTGAGTPARGTALPRGPRKRGGLGRLLRRGRDEQDQQHEIHEPYAVRAPQTPRSPGQDAAGPGPAPAAGPGAAETWPDAAALLLTALGPGPRLWERGPEHPESLSVRLGTVDRTGPDGAGLLPAVPVTVGLAEAGALGLAGPRARLTGLARCALAQLAALHAPDRLEIVLVATDRARPVEQRIADWSWLGWLPHVRPAHGQDCRLLLAYDREQAAARTGELLRRLDDHAAGHGPYANPAAGSATAATSAAASPSSPASPASPASPSSQVSPLSPVSTVVVVDGDPGSASLREATVRLAAEGAAAGIHVVCLAETPAASPSSPVTETYEAACAQSPAFRACGAVALLSGDVATALRLHRAARGQLVGHGTVATLDAVSLAWAQRFARALAPLRTDAAVGSGEPQARVSAPLPQVARLLDELGLARATPASLLARWAAAADDQGSLGGRVWAVLGAGPRGPVGVDLAADGPHLLVEGPAGSGRTELLRSVTASLAAAERPDRLGIVLVDGQGPAGGPAGERAEGLRVCTDLPHVTTHLTANDPVRMREFAQSLATELKRRAELIGRTHFTEWHTQRAVSGRMVAQRVAPSAGAGDLEAPPSSTIRLRPGAAREKAEAAPPLPRLVVVVDDLDALLAPPLGSPGRPAAGSVVRALEAVARDGERLGVHLVAAFASGGAPGWSARPLVTLDPVGSGPEDPAPGRGVLHGPDGRTIGMQAGRVTGRIPRTATQRPTVVALDWARMGDPPDRRPVRELGNGPTDLALLASALERAARSVAAQEVPSLL
ncbi:FHA domain-containing protein [Streptomyces sp. NPDC050085]|uniref:FHA domain-containing protein n=1 Tax=Streptomyces sp. NPDC050085 TaxID=3365600 RepID=UPI0037B54AA3